MQNFQSAVKNNSRLMFVLAVFVVIFTAFPVFAAEIIIKSETQEVKIGDQFQVDIFLNAENEDINAVEGKVIFLPEFIELKEIRDGGSIINLWIEKPRLESVGDIVFSGITPGGIKSEKGKVISLIFEAKREGDGSINISNTSVLKNDGKGTPIKTKISDLKFRISKSENQIEGPKLEIPVDTDSPESFKPEIAQSPDIFDGKYFLVFVTQDKGSGIARYEVLEGVWGKFITVESPYLLRNQKLDKKIAIKAIDKEGNERVEIIYPQNWSPWYENYLIIGIIVLGIIIGYLIRKRWGKNIGLRENEI